MTPPMHDSFRNWDGVYAHRNVELVRRFARVPRRPDVRVSPADLNHDVPPDALRAVRGATSPRPLPPSTA